MNFILFFIALIAPLKLKHPASILMPVTAAIPSPQEQLPHASLTLGTHHLDVQLALDNASREEGLMKQTHLEGDKGMLFVFPHAQRVAFWMKNTSIPLSIAYISSNGRIVEIHDMTPFSETSLLSSSGNIVYALEVPRDWFSKNGVLAGDLVNGLPSPTLAR